MPNLDARFSSYRLKLLNLPNRVVMAPMTRFFSPGGMPIAGAAAHCRRRNMLFFTSHFAESSAGRVGRISDRLTWTYE